MADVEESNPISKGRDPLALYPLSYLVQFRFYSR